MVGVCGSTKTRANLVFFFLSLFPTMLGSWTGLLAPRAVAPASGSPTSSSADEEAACCSASPSPSAAAAPPAAPALPRVWWIQERLSDVLIQQARIEVDGAGVLRLHAATGGEVSGGASVRVGGIARPIVFSFESARAATPTDLPLLSPLSRLSHTLFPLPQLSPLLALHIGGLQVLDLEGEDADTPAPAPAPAAEQAAAEAQQQPSTLRRLLFPRTEPAAAPAGPARQPRPRRPPPPAKKWAHARLVLKRPGVGGEPLLVLAADTEADHRRLAAALAAAAAAHPRRAASPPLLLSSRPGSAAAVGAAIAPPPSPFPPGLTKWSSAGRDALWASIAAGLGPDDPADARTTPYPPLPPGVYDPDLRLVEHDPRSGRAPALPDGLPYYCLSNGHTFSVREMGVFVLLFEKKNTQHVPSLTPSSHQKNKKKTLSPSAPGRPRVPAHHPVRARGRPHAPHRRHAPRRPHPAARL
jgi:hypothetical protein